MAITLYHPRHDNGERDDSQPLLRHAKTFRPQPTDEQMEKLRKAGWKESPHELAGYQHPASAQEMPYDFDATEVDIEDALALDEGEERGIPAGRRAVETAAPEAPKDIRLLAAKDALRIIETISEPAVLQKIRAREQAGAKPRVSVLNAIDARLEQVSG